MPSQRVNESTSQPVNQSTKQPVIQSSGAALRAFPLLLTVALALAAGGCGNKDVVEIEDKAHFHQVVDDANRPLLLFLGKDGCALCVAMDPVTTRLATEYKGRATVAHYPLMTFVFIPRSMEIVRKYDVTFYPTAILFVKGKEAGRWVANYDLDEYRLALDEVVPPDPNAPHTRPARTTRPGRTTRPAQTTQSAPATRPGS